MIEGPQQKVHGRETQQWAMKRSYNENHSRDPGLSQQSATAEVGQSENDLCHCGSSVGPLPLTQKPWAPCHCATVAVPAPIPAHSPLPVCPSAGGPFPPPFALTSLPLFGNFTDFTTKLLSPWVQPKGLGTAADPPPPTMTTLSTPLPQS